MRRSFWVSPGWAQAEGFAINQRPDTAFDSPADQKMGRAHPATYGIEWMY